MLVHGPRPGRDVRARGSPEEASLGRYHRIATSPDRSSASAARRPSASGVYVAPGWTGRGIGSRLIELAKSRRPGGLDLYTFQVNAGARRFYERQGFVEVARGDGSDNEEGQPDIRYAWRPSS
jgi:ribosomal protein S18 acetylase RimI-like enzyme